MAIQNLHFLDCHAPTPDRASGLAMTTIARGVGDSVLETNLKLVIGDIDPFSQGVVWGRVCKQQDIG